MDLHVHRWGELGAPALLVHGSVTGGEMTWAEQRPLAERWSLLVLDRRGYAPNPPMEEGEDFEVDAADVTRLLAEHGPLHLMGHSYGAVVSLLAAARLPQGVRSLSSSSRRPSASRPTTRWCKARPPGCVSSGDGAPRS